MEQNPQEELFPEMPKFKSGTSTLIDVPGNVVSTENFIKYKEQLRENWLVEAEAAKDANLRPPTFNEWLVKEIWALNYFGELLFQKQK